MLLAVHTTKFAVLATSLLVTVPLSCKNRSQPPQNPTPVGARAYEEFAATIKSYPYDASPETKIRVLKGYPKLEIGMTKAQVRSIIGEPDYGQQSYGPKGPNERWLGSSWTYYLRMRDALATEDSHVELFFGTDGKTDWITSTILGLDEKPPPTTTRPSTREMLGRELIGRSVFLVGKYGPGKMADCVVIPDGDIYLMGEIESGSRKVEYGSTIAVEGKLEYKKYDRSTQKHSVRKDQPPVAAPHDHYFMRDAKVQIISHE
jgi:hypothetical protein